jgi:hypothetical protein
MSIMPFSKALSYHSRRHTTAMAALAAMRISHPALAQSVCVHCTGPDQDYVCNVSAEGFIPAKPIGLFCASKIAGEHSHESCAVQNTPTACTGVEVSYVYRADSPGSLAAEPQDVNAAPGEPATLGEFTKDTVNASAKSVKKAGENIGEAASNAGSATANAIKGAGNAIGDATKKTLKCLGSALNDC